MKSAMPWMSSVLKKGLSTLRGASRCRVSALLTAQLMVVPPEVRLFLYP